ncbi:MAG TPA: leucine-rich repeat domain-containing protein [Cyclobacteriaceae bacterium]|nr:leucine-rich repeat domain-containing protein [Cyclobacteriaceae bacterium]
MKQNSLRIILVCLLVGLTSVSYSQKSKPDPSKDDAKVKDIIAFLEYVLNTLGSSETQSRDKDVLISESYTKIFRDGKVQVEDDLDENRKVITNKDVVAYLKDVDFFFNDVKFEFTIDNIKGSTNANGTYFYKVSARRNLKGTTSEGKVVNNTIPRFIEVNYDPNNQDLKIVSIYTKEFNEKEAYTKWWNELSYQWHEIFMRKLNLTDSVTLDDIRNVASIENLDLSRNAYIQTIEPLSLLTSLKTLDLSNTPVNDITPIRNLTDLVDLNLSNTNVEDLTPLKYSNNISKLNLHHTLVGDISVIGKMQKLQGLDISETPTADFYPVTFLNELTSLNLAGTKLLDLSSVDSLLQLTDLNISKTSVIDLMPLKELKGLTTLYIDSTQVQNIGPLSNLENLKFLSANHTPLENLQPLQKLPKLQKVYCDHTRVTRMVAENFMAIRPKVIVVYDSKDLLAWWNTLPSQWQGVFSETADIGLAPTKDELAKITGLDSINLKNKYSVFDLEPLQKLPLLKVLILDRTAVHDLTPIKGHRDIQYLDISNTEVKDLGPISQFKKLKELRADTSKVEDVSPLYNLSSLSKVYLDQTTIHDIIAQEFLEQNPHCLFIYKTNHLSRWWSSLTPEWKKVFYDHMGNDTASTRENLHRLAELEKLQLEDEGVKDLTALSEFVRLKELNVSGSAINDLTPLATLKSLRSLHLSNSPVEDVEALSELSELEDLDLSNTPIDELKVIGKLSKLRKFNCSGTQIKKLDALENLEQLEQLDCSNTFVSKLDPLEGLPLKTLKCFNTKISSKSVDKFRKNKPDCNVIYYR